MEPPVPPRVTRAILTSPKTLGLERHPRGSSLVTSEATDAYASSSWIRFSRVFQQWHQTLDGHIQVQASPSNINPSIHASHHGTLVQAVPCLCFTGRFISHEPQLHTIWESTVIDLTLSDYNTCSFSHPTQIPLLVLLHSRFSRSPSLSMSLSIQLASTEPQLFQGALVSQA